MHKNLRQYLHVLESQGELKRIDARVDPYLEIAEIHRRVVAANGPALFFTNVAGKNFPVVTNMFGSRKRVLQAFGPRPQEFVAQIAGLAHELMPPSLGKLWRARGVFWQLTGLGAKMTSQAPVLKCRVPDGDLEALPTLTSWIEDGGPFFTLPLVHTFGFDGMPDNLGMYRVQIHEKHEAGMHFQIGKGGGFHLHQARQRQQNLPCHVYLGGPPALILAAIAPLPENVGELMLASLVLGERLRKTKIAESPLPVVSECEFALVGEVPWDRMRPEGPFGDHYGYYSLKHDFPVFRPKHIYHRPGAIFPATIVGKPKQEDFYLGDYLQELLSPMFSIVMPGVLDLWSYGECGYHTLSAVCLRERYEREAMATAFRILGEGQLSFTKILLAVDQRLDLKNFSQVLTHVLERVDWRKDFYIFSQLSMDTLDYTGPKLNHGSKAVILGLGSPRRKLPESYNGPTVSGLFDAAQAFCPGCLVVQIPPYTSHKDIVSDLVKHPALQGWQLIVAVDDVKKALRSEAAFIWTTFTRFAPGSDVYTSKAEVSNHHIMYEAPIGIDARMKPSYPKELFCDDATRKKVDTRWLEYFPQSDVAMGSSDWAHL